MANSVKATWLGHSTFTFETPEGKTLLIDPWVKNNPMCPPNLKKLAKVDLVLCTHGHFDHIGDAVEICKEHNPMVVGIFELCAWLNKKGAKQISPMNKGGSQTVENVRVTMVDAVHSSGIQDGDSIIYGGEPCGFVMEFSNGQKIYHAGDTAVFGDMALIREHLCAADRDAAHRRPFHHGPARGRDCLPPAASKVSDSHALRHLPGVDRQAERSGQGRSRTGF